MKLAAINDGLELKNFLSEDGWKRSYKFKCNTCICPSSLSEFSLERSDATFGLSYGEI